MTPKEFHIALDLAGQKLNSSAYGNIKSEMKDWLLNESVNKFIKNRINPKSNNKKEGFADTIKRYDDLEDLITPAFINLYKLDENNIYGILPYNYFYLLSSKTKVAFDCNGLTNSTLTSVKERMCAVTFKDAPSGLYNNFKIEIDNGNGFITVIDGNDYPYLASGVPDLQAKFIFINLVLQYYNNNSIDGSFVVWETYDNIYKQGCFIFISPVILATSIKITTDTIDTYNFIDINYDKHNYIISDSYYKNRIVKTDDYDELIIHPFGNTIPSSPISKLERGRIIVNHSKKFISNTLQIEFIRKPRKIDINLNQGCELDESVHDEIVAITVQKIKAILDSKNYQNIINENQLIE